MDHNIRSRNLHITQCNTYLVAVKSDGLSMRLKHVLACNQMASAENFFLFTCFTHNFH